MSHIVRCFTTAPKGLDEEMIQKIVKRDEELRRDYYDMPSSFPETSQPPSGHVTMEDALRKRLLHRSRQRGMLEVDLLLGKWAKLNLNRLSRDELDQYEALLNSETVDIFSWITDKSPLPPEMDMPIVREIQKWVKSKPFGIASPEEYAKNKEFFSNYCVS